jgi:cysteine desulfurase/selenocysteine lyase
MVCEERRAKLRVVGIDDRGDLRLDELDKLLGPRTRLLALAHVSNALGTVNPVREIVKLAHSRGVPVLLDGAQAVPHQKVDVREIGCDFYAFSSHKLFGPTGVGVLYGRAERLEALPPYQGGGDMILSVRFEETTYQGIPHKFEAGTPDIAAVIGFGAAIDYVSAVGLDAIHAHEQDLLRYASEQLARVPGLRLIGTAREKAAVISFVLDGVHAHDVGTILDQEGIAVRTGHHCAQPVMERYGVPATVRASFALYNTRADVDALVRGLGQVRKVFA